jgi:CRISPR-associated endonuclease/helicase Cas3
LFESLPIRDPHGFILDEAEETRLDPFHLLRYYEFIQNGDYIELTHRASETYQLNFRLRYNDSRQQFVNTELNKLTAFKNCQIIRNAGGAIRPTPLIQELNKYLLPGVIICPITNAAAVFQLNRQGITSHPIIIVCNDGDKEYRFFAGLSGILTMAMKFKQLRLPDDEVFIA